MKKLESVARVHTHTHTISLRIIEINGNIEIRSYVF